MDFIDWLRSTLKMQRDDFNFDPPSLRGADLGEYVRWNVLAATDELHEFLNEFRWKPWDKSLEGVVIDRDAAVGELVDVMHFVANLLVALDVSGEELSLRYAAKQEKNRQRQARGYDAVANRCPNCQRALDDVGWTATLWPGDRTCNACGAILPVERSVI